MTMVPKHTFRAIIEDAGGGAFVTIPFDVEQVFGKKRVPVKATLDGQPYRGSLVRMGGPRHVLGIRKDIRARVGKTIGDEIEVVIEEDTEPRLVAIPDDLKAALDNDPEAAAVFEKLAYSHQREYVLWIEEARRAETRQKRISRTVERLKQRE